jgi:hypothetical protein
VSAMSKDKFRQWAALLVAGVAALERHDDPDLADEPMGGRLPQPLGPAVWGTDSRPRFNGTNTSFVPIATATSTATETVYW